MIINTPIVEIKDQLMGFIARGFDIVGHGLRERRDESIAQLANEWASEAVAYLELTFPTNKETGQFLYSTGNSYGYNDMAPAVENVINSTQRRVKVLEDILNTLESYYQFQLPEPRLYIQSIDSFSRVRNINPEQVHSLLNNGHFDIPEREVKEAFAQIIGQSYIPADWGGETEDIYSSLVLLNGERVQTSIILKGTTRTRETHLGDLGANGDQLERMMRSPSSKLYIIQSIKPVGQDIINSADSFVRQKRAQGQDCYYCIIDGQDTAMLLRAYDLINNDVEPESSSSSR